MIDFLAAVNHLVQRFVGVVPFHAQVGLAAQFGPEQALNPTANVSNICPVFKVLLENQASCDWLIN